MSVDSVNQPAVLRRLTRNHGSRRRVTQTVCHVTNLKCHDICHSTPCSLSLSLLRVVSQATTLHCFRLSNIIMSAHSVSMPVRVSEDFAPGDSESVLFLASSSPWLSCLTVLVELILVASICETLTLLVKRMALLTITSAGWFYPPTVPSVMVSPSFQSVSRSV